MIDVREEWRSKKASGGRTLCLHLACEQALLFGRARTRELAPKPRGAFLYPASGFSISSRVPLARLLFTISAKWRTCSQGSLHSVMKQWNYWSALIGATNGNRPTLHDLLTDRKIFLSAAHQNKGPGGKDTLRDRGKMQECHEFNETVKNILSDCSELAERPYLY